MDGMHQCSFNPCRHIGTNYSPLDEEIREIKRYLVEPTAKLAALEGQLQALQSESRLLRDHIDQHRTLISPFRRLPPETLGEIFIHCLPEGWCDFKVNNAPLLLGRVCSKWRNLAYSQRRLWTNLRFPFPLHHHFPSTYPQGPVHSSLWPLPPPKVAPPPPTVVLEAVHEWLARSHPLPVDLSLAVEKGEDDEDFEYPLKAYLDLDCPEFDEFIKAFASYASRWRKISLFAPILHEKMAPIREVSPECLVHLREVKLNFLRLGPGHCEVPYLNVPHLKSVLLYNDVEKKILDASVHWSSVTVLRMEDLWAPEYTSVLSNCPQLVECYVSVWKDLHDIVRRPVLVGRPTTTKPQGPPIELVHLEVLEFDIATFVTRGISAPNLRKLKYGHSSYWDIERDSPGFLKLQIFGDLGRLEEIWLKSGRQLDREDLESLLIRAPGLAKLRLKNESSLPTNLPIDDQFMQLFIDGSPNGTSSQLCPLLRSLEIQSCVPVSKDMMMKFIRSRRESRLRDVTVVLYGNDPLPRNSIQNWPT